MTGPRIDSVISQLEQAALHAIAGDFRAATAAALLIDPQERLRERFAARTEVRSRIAASGQPVVVVRDQKGRSPSRSIRLAVYAGDRYICRYRHCQRATVDERVVAALSLLMPQALPYHRNWPADRAHPLVWTHLASLEHVKPWSTGGDNSLDNLVTTCSLCNYTKNNASVAQLNWQVNVETREDIVWDGLTSLLPQLQRMVNER